MAYEVWEGDFGVFKEVIGHGAEIGEGFEAVVDDGKDLFFVGFWIWGGRFWPEIDGAGIECINSLFVGDFANPLTIHPEDFDFVKAGARGLDAVDGETLDEFFFGVDFFFGAVIPTETSKVIQECFGEDAVVAVFGGGFGAVAFAEFFVTLGGEDVRKGEEFGRGEIKGFIKRKIIRGAR